MLTDNGAIDCNGQEYTITDEEIKIAHPMEMDKADVTAWQKYFSDNNLKQPFAQVWEPVRDPAQVKEDRYKGCRLEVYQFSGKDKHGIHAYGVHAYSDDFGFELDDCELGYDCDTWRLDEIKGVYYTLGKFSFKKFTRKVNHIITILDKMTVADKVLKDDVSIEESTKQVEIFDTAIAIMAGLMIIPAVFAFSGDEAASKLQAGPSLMFITMPKIFASMSFGAFFGCLFFLLVLFAALTSAIALAESAVSTFEDELHWSRRRCTVLLGIIMIVLGSLSALGYGPLANVTIFGMQFLDLFDFLTNSVMMPLAAMATCLLIIRVITVEKICGEIELDGAKFVRKPVFNFMIRYLCPFFVAIILFSSVASVLGFIKM